MSIVVDQPYGQQLVPFTLKEIYQKTNLFITRPPYQRKGVWTNQMKEALITSLFRRHYVPNIVLREVHTPSPDNNGMLAKFEVVDGQQRIIAVQDFYKELINLPDELSDITSEAGKKYSKLIPTVQDHIDHQVLNATVLGNLTNPHDKKNQQIVAKVFWNLQQGKTLTYMEVEHSKLYSASRNFITKYADDMSFDYGKYDSVDSNPNRHNFFKILNVDNDRLDHLAILGRFLLLEDNEGPTELGTKYFSDFVDSWNNRSDKEFENSTQAKNCLKTLDTLYQIFKNDPSVKSGGIVPELDKEYIIISVYLLARRLVHDDWNFTPMNYEQFRLFTENFYKRWAKDDPKDAEMEIFKDQRQQNKKAVEKRDQLITEWFFKSCPKLNKLDPDRTFSYVDRIAIYRKNKGICKMCKDEGKSDEDSTVPWHIFEADHVKPRSKEGETTIRNGQVLCQHHNRVKNNKWKTNG
jgi:hypothetical protein